MIALGRRKVVVQLWWWCLVFGVQLAGARNWGDAAVAGFCLAMPFTVLRVRSSRRLVVKWELVKDDESHWHYERDTSG